MKKQNNNAGASMVEVMIYMVIGLIVIGYALNSMEVISTGYVRGRTVMKMQKDGLDVVQVMARDIANTGFKFYVDQVTRSVKHDFDGNNDYNDNNSPKNITFYMTRPSPTIQTYSSDYSTANNTPVGLPDDRPWYFASYCGKLNVVGTDLSDSSASFIHVEIDPADPNDELTFYRMRMSNDSYDPQDIVRVRYYVSGTTLFREELVSAVTGGLDQTIVGLPTPSDAQITTARNSIWNEGDVETVAILDNIAALQFLFYSNGAGWVTDPTGVRHNQTMIKIQLLVASSRRVDGASSPAQTLADGSVTIAPVDNTLFRLYEKIVEIPNNGTVALPN